MVKQQIIEKSEEFFMRYGIRSVSMDDIARELGISKKTLYQQVENKSDLIEQIFAVRSMQEQAEISRMREAAGNAIEEMIVVARFMIGRLRLVSPTTRYDLEKYYKDIHRQMEARHTEFFTWFIKDNLKRGIEEGWYRPTLVTDVVAKFFVGMATRLARNEYFDVRAYGLDELVEQLFLYHVHGVASEAGMGMVRKYLGKEDEEHL